MHATIRFLTTLALATGAVFSPIVLAHGDVTPQAVDVSTLKPLGEQKRDENPFRGDKEAIRVGTSAYNQNCARCHGLEAISGGIAPDLRKLEIDKETDIYFRDSVMRGKVRNGAVYMPPFEGILSQEAIWAIRSYLDTRYEDEAAPVNEMAALAKKSNCLSCHAVDARGVGPAYREVAKKYAKDKNAEAKLLTKVKKGGSGSWGKVPMPPMDGVPEQDLKSLIKWIMAGAN
ncbi:MAG: cytochrome c-550 PedF [Sulfuritalea sp.]|nr:cytochrome c-550 PedF [Sulfuritalea sp.]